MCFKAFGQHVFAEHAVHHCLRYGLCITPSEVPLHSLLPLRLQINDADARTVTFKQPDLPAAQIRCETGRIPDKGYFFRS